MKKSKLILYSMASITVVSIAAVFLFSNINKGEEAVLRFIKKHPENVSFTLIHNEEVVAAYHSNRMMPLASVVKIMVALEYAQQAADGKISPHEYVKLADIDKYYIPKLDGGAQPEWGESLKSRKLIKDDSVALEEVAKGMIDFSSNANMEYLIERLGMDPINSNIAKLGLTNHQKVFPIYSSLLIPYEIMQKNPDLPQEERIKKAKEELRTMSQEQFQTFAIQQHEKLKNDVDGSYKRTAAIEEWYDEEFDKILSDRMVASTTEDYGLLLSKINSRTTFSPQVHQHLDAVMEGPMQNPANKESFKHLGFKGGSTNYVLNTAMYAVDKDNQSTEILLFTNNLESKEYQNFSKNINAFLNGVLTKPEFRKKVSDQIGVMNEGPR
ncbi:serine hydrolase [Paenibacillus sp. DMB20]|uniref:serine hydrolase n=1 Tax=Paenibacillus sp. DMB20 TaxID=1642570 RepID=UPI00069BD6AA|nr:serine hydrolase [Paenibacillus sp. DMB20]